MRIARLMKENGLSHQLRRRFRPMSLTDSNHDLPIAPNHLLHRMPTQKPDAVWVADITYVPTLEGWLYVAGVLDRCTRRCIGWAMGDSLHTSLPLAALDMALTLNADRHRDCCTIPIAASNTPLKVIGNDWRKRALFQA